MRINCGLAHLRIKIKTIIHCVSKLNIQTRGIGLNLRNIIINQTTSIGSASSKDIKFWIRSGKKS